MNHFDVKSSTIVFDVMYSGKPYTMIVDQNEWNETITLIDDETRIEIETNSSLYDEIVEEYYSKGHNPVIWKS